MKKNNLVQIGTIGKEYYTIMNGKIEKYTNYKDLEKKIEGIEHYTVINYSENAILTLPKQPKKRGRKQGTKLTTEKTEKKILSVRFKAENLKKLKDHCEKNKISQGELLEKIFVEWYTKTQN